MALFEARRLEGDTRVESGRRRVRVPVGSVDGVGRELFHGSRDASRVGVRVGAHRCCGDSGGVTGRGGDGTDSHHDGHQQRNGHEQSGNHYVDEFVHALGGRCRRDRAHRPCAWP